MAEGGVFPLRCHINGEFYEFDVAFQELLIDLLRERLGLIACKRSCDIEICGACTVLLNKEPVSACCTLAWEARDGSITTLEGLGRVKNLSELQQSFLEHFAVQCGFCTPGMLVTAHHLLSEDPSPTEDKIKKQLAGNICRCGAYASIAKAVLAAARQGQD